MSPERSSDDDSIETTRALWARMMNANEYSDFIIKCHSKTFHVHRVVVCTQSKPIKAAANGNFRESITGILDLEDDDPNTVARMINFLYTQDYDDTTTSEESDIEPHGPLFINTMLYIIADKYDIPGLKRLAIKKFETALRTDWNSASFTASLHLLYEQLPASDTCLSARALRAACLHARDLKDREDFTALCRSNADIAYDLFATMASEPVALALMPGSSEVRGRGRGLVAPHMETETETHTERPRQTQRKSNETCPKGHGFKHLDDLRSMLDEKTGRWRVRCANCAAQKVFFGVDNSCDLGARWDGVDAGFWYL